MNQNNQIKDKNKNELINYKKENYDIDSPESNINLTNKNNKDNNEDNNKFELFNENKIKNEEEKVRKNEEFIIFPNIKEEEEENKINRFSNLKDIELPLEDKIQIQNQVDNDNDNESEQIEVIENILNNFEKEKYKNNKFLEYKNKNKKIKKKSQSVTKSKNNILNKIKHDIAIINFEQEINKICNNHNHNLILKGEKLNINIINNNHINYNNKSKSKSKNNMLRIEEIRKKLFSGNDIFSKSKSITNHKRNENKIFFNKKNNEDNFYNSCNNFYNTTKQKSKVNNNLFNDINNIKEIKINNYNFNRIYNNFYDTFRNKITDIDKENKVIMPFNTIMGNKNHLKTDESPTINSFYNSNQFFFNVFKNSIKEYPYLHLLTKKVNKMKCNDFSKNKLNNKKSMDIIENKDKDKDKNNEQKISILEKINRQKDIFQKEIDKYKRK